MEHSKYKHDCNQTFTNHISALNNPLGVDMPFNKPNQICTDLMTKPQKTFDKAKTPLLKE